MSPLTLRLKQLREARKLTQLQLAELAGVSRATVNRLEQRPPRLIDVDALEALAAALEVDPSYLLIWVPLPKRHRKNTERG